MAIENITLSSPASLNAVSKYRYLRSVFLTENAGTPAEAKIEFRDGGPGGTVFFLLKFSANQTHAYSFTRPIYFPSGIYMNCPTGVVVGGIDAD
ncbi:hypothetical protein GYA93_15720 [Gordonia desulfuricans]|uniref:Uncharacterized protein n=1 Tax=Gordonia desulfuricans TaxID=89051 RepID=A0A7K3LS17_9ACTN|nr:hypothetical protein [Gordonia desulfuricans]NDK91020.1 hypothetical protein [Gordonia desulfuricans]